MLHQTQLADSTVSRVAVPGQQARASGLEVRLASCRREIDAAQALRYRVFYEEMNATPSTAMRWRERDFDAYDDVSDHLLVIDPKRGSGTDRVVGTYRLLRGRKTRTPGSYLPPPGFCASAEFDIEPLLHLPGEILELGRACVDPAYRTRQTIDLLWQGIAAYVRAYSIGVMFGCASFPGTDASRLREPLALLHHKRLAPPELRPRAHAERYVPMNTIPVELLDERAAMRAMPPLLKGYLRLGAVFGDGAVVDNNFDTIDVCVVVQTTAITDRYYRRYQRHLRENDVNAFARSGETA